MKVSYSDPSQSTIVDIQTIENNTNGSSYVTPMTGAISGADVNRARLAEGQALIAEIEEKEAKRAAALKNYQVMTNTKLSSSVDLTSVDMTSALPEVTPEYLAERGLPNPEDYGLEIDDVIDMSAVDLSDMPLPMPDLTKLPDGCFDPSGMYMSSLIDLSSLDMRGWGLPSFDFGDFSIPSWKMFDLSSIDLSGIIDLSDIKLPEWTNPFSFDIDWDLDLSSKFDGLKNIFDGMGGDGDLLGMGSLSMSFGKIGCVGAAITDVLSNNAIVNALKNFDIPDMSGIVDSAKDGIGYLLDKGSKLGDLVDKIDIDGFDGFDKINDLFQKVDFDMPSWAKELGLGNGTVDDVSGAVIAAIGYLGDNWYWYDKDRGKYHYDNIAQLNPKLIKILKTSGQYNDLVGLFESIRGHHIYIKNR